MNGAVWDFCILAAGQGKRMESSIPKVMLPALGRPLLQYLLDAPNPNVYRHTVVVVSPDTQEAVASVAPGAQVVVQEHRRGTADALKSALPALTLTDGNILVIYGDMPLITEETLQHFTSFFTQEAAQMALLCAHAPFLSGYGRIFRDDKGRVMRVVEERDCSPQELEITEMNLGVYAFRCNILEEILENLDDNNAQGEFYLTETVDMCRKHGYTVAALPVPWSEEFLGVNTPGDYSRVLSVLRERKAALLFDRGVKIIDPASTYVDWEATIEKDVWLYPGTIIEGKSTIGRGSHVGPYSHVYESRVGERCRVKFSVVEGAVVEEGVTVGPFSHLRAGSHLMQGVRVGNFVETKEATLDSGTKALHLAYLGDATIGKNVNIGAGAITCNYDGVRKHHTIIGDGAFIGTHNALVAPVRVGKGAYTAAGSTITRDVPPYSLGVGRSRQANKEGWVKKKSAGDTK